MAGVAAPLRDVALLWIPPLLRRLGYGLAPPVHFLGKAATAALMYAFPLLFLASHHAWYAEICWILGWAFAIWGTGLYWWAGVLYVVQVHRLDEGVTVKAVVMAGGEGTRLRPMTATQPKPLLPVVNRPIMEHVLRLLKRHGYTETVVTVQFLAPLIRNYFGDGDELGMTSTTPPRRSPSAPRGACKNAADRAPGRAVPRDLR